MNIICEKKHVHEVYSKIAMSFDKTRYNPWPQVVKFVQSLEPNTKLLDIGCGNGKYFSLRNDIKMYGCDTCAELIDIVRKKYKNSVNITHIENGILPYKMHYFDNVISIAVLHHISTVQGRKNFLQEAWRTLKYGGTLYITVWSYDVKDRRRPKWTCIDRTHPQDVFIPWNDTQTNTQHLRYYHLFTENELSELIKTLQDVKTISFTLEHDNIHCIILKQTLSETISI